MRALLAVTVVAAVLASAAGAQSQAAPTGAGITIAILDTGIDAMHSEVSGRVTRESHAAPPVPVLGVPLPLPTDPNGQGTAVASITAGASLGVASRASLLDMQVSAKYTGVALVDPATESAAIAALDALLQNPARAQIVLLSFAQSGVSADGARTLAAQTRSLWDAGVLTVVPTGPASNALTTASHVLTVGPAEICAQVAASNLKPDLVAPSQNLQAAQPGTGLPGGVTQVSGSAYAAAQVAGAAALLMESNPRLPRDAVAAFLRDAARDVGEPGPDSCNGFGELDVAAALVWALMWHDPLTLQATRDTPGPPFALVGFALVAAVVVRRRA